MVAFIGIQKKKKKKDVKGLSDLTKEMAMSTC